jgi:FkbM family methyltransferase
LQRRILPAVFSGSQIEPYEITAGPAAGLRLALKLPQERVYWLGTYELPVAEKLAAEIRAGDVCWDVGAYIGFFSALMAHKSGACVTCFEPFPDNRRRLAMQADLNQHLKLSILPLALAAEAGTAEFLVAAESTMGKLAASTFQEGVQPCQRIAVETTTIDRVVESGRAAPPALIKIDTEGAEYAVLAGGMDTLAKHRPRILLEYHGCPDDSRLLELLSRCEYRCEVVESHEPLERHGVQPGQHLWCTPANAKVNA